MSQSYVGCESIADKARLKSKKLTNVKQILKLKHSMQHLHKYVQ